MGRPSRFSPELKERAVRMVQEHASEHPSQWAAIEALAPKLGCGTESLRRWVRQAERDTGKQGAVRGRACTPTTHPAPVGDRPADLVARNFAASRPNQLWVSDFTYVATWGGFVYVAFVIDAFARRIVGWRVSASLRTDFVLDALEQALYDRQGADLAGLVHHGDRGTQYLSMRYTDRLADAGIAPTGGSRGSPMTTPSRNP